MIVIFADFQLRCDSGISDDVDDDGRFKLVEPTHNETIKDYTSL